MTTATRTANTSSIAYRAAALVGRVGGHTVNGAERVIDYTAQAAVDANAGLRAGYVQPRNQRVLDLAAKYAALAAEINASVEPAPIAAPSLIIVPEVVIARV